MAIPDATLTGAGYQVNPLVSPSGGGSSNVTLAIGRKVSVVGDSIPAQAVITPTSSLTGWTSNSFLAWVRKYLGYRIDLPASRVYAVSGAVIADVQNLQMPQVLADKPDVLLMRIGTNDVGVTTTANAIAGYTSILTACAAANIFVVIISIRVRGTSSQWNTAAKRQQFAYLNRWLNSYALANPKKAMYLDPNPVLIDFASANGDARAGLFYDGLHDNIPSAQLDGKYIADALSPLLPLMDGRFSLVSDIYDATNNPTGNLLANGLFTGTGGNSAINGSTGTSAANWDVGRNNGGSTVTVAGSKAADAVYSTMENNVVTFGGTADGNTIFVSSSLAGGDSRIAVGDKLYFEGEVEFGMTQPTLGGIQAFVQCQNSSYANLAFAYDGLYQPGYGGLPTTGVGTMYFRTEAIAVPATSFYITAGWTMTPMSAGAIAGTLKFKRAALRKAV